MKKARLIFIGLIVAMVLVALPLAGALAQDNLPAPLDPQSWKMQRDMGWNDWVPNPFIDWVNDTTVKPARVLRGVLVLVDFPDRSFIVTDPVGTDMLGNPVVGGVSKADLADFWRDYLLVPSEGNNYVTLNSYWKENTYGRQDIELEACGPYTLSRFEFQYGSLGITTVQRFDSIFPRGTGMATEAYNLAKASGDVEFFKNGQPAYDFIFFIHAGYDPSGLWQEFGEMMFLTRNDISKEFSGLGRMENIEAKISAPGFNLATAYPNFYMFTKPTATAEINNFYASYKEVFFADAYASAKAQDAALTESAFETNTFRPAYNTKFADNDQYKAMVPDLLKGHLLRAKNAANNTNGNTWMMWAATRYVPWTSWFASMNFWTTEGTVRDAEFNFTWDVSTQAESDGMATFAHEFGHIRSLPDNYNAPFTLPMTRSYTGPWELMSRGSFGGPGGNHQRYQIPATMGGSAPPNQMLDARLENLFTAEEDLVNVTVAELVANGPVVAEVVARNIPTNNSAIDYGVDGFRGLKLTGFRDQTPRDNNTLDPLNNSGGNLMDNPDALRTKIDPVKWNWGTFRNSPQLTHDSYTIEVVERKGYDSFQNDHGVMISKHASARQNYQPNSFIIDAHPGPLGIIDFIRPNGVQADMTDGDQLQLVAALFHAGVHNNPNYGDTFTGNYLYGPLFGDKPLSSPIVTKVAGNVVNEFVDSYNNLHFYILDKIDNPAANGSFLSYQVAVRSSAATAAKVGGDLEVAVSAVEAEMPKNVAVATFSVTNSGAATDIVRIAVDGYLPGVILNNIYAIPAGETVKVPVYVELPLDIRTRSLTDQSITLTASSETNGEKVGTAAVKVTDLTNYNYSVYLVPQQTILNDGDTLFVDVMLAGFSNYTQVSAEITYDTSLLAYTGYDYLTGWVAAASPVAPNKVSLRSMPSSNMVMGAPCSPDVKIATLKFTIKDTFEGDRAETALSFASAFVNPAGNLVGAGTAPAEPLTVTLRKPTVFTAGEIVRQFIIDDPHHGEYCTEDAQTVRAFGPGTKYGPIMTNGVIDPLFEKGGYLFGPTDAEKLKIYAIAVDFTDAMGDMQIPYGRHRNVVKSAYNGTVFDFSDPQIHFETQFKGTTALKANPKFTWLGTNAQEFKGIAQILEEQSMGRMQVDVELLNERLALAQGIDTSVERTPWFHINGPIFAYSDAGPADCEDYRQFARLYQAAVFAAVEQLEAAGLNNSVLGEGSNIEDIGFIYIITPFNAFGYRLGFQGGGGIMSSYSFNEQVLAQRDSEYRHVPGVLTPGGRMVGSGVFGMKGIVNPGNSNSISPNIGNALHELTHGLGMFDDYSYGSMGTNRGEATASGSGNWGVMGSNMSSVSPDPPIWRKFRQGWLYDDEITVILPGDNITLNLRAAGSAPGKDGGSYTDDPSILTRMVVIPKEYRTRDTFGIDWANGWNPYKLAYNWYDWFTNIYVGGETYAMKSFPTFYTLESRKALGADGNPLGRYTGLPATRAGVVVSYIANPTWETGHGAGGFKVMTGDNGLKEGASWSDANIGLTVTILESNIFFDKVNINYTGKPTSEAKHVYQGMLKLSDSFVTAGETFTVDFDLTTLGTPAVNDATAISTSVQRVATPLAVPGGIAGFEMEIKFDAATFEYVSFARAPFNYTVNTAGAATGTLIIKATGSEMIDKDTILSLNFKAKAGGALGDYAVNATISDVTLINWRGDKIKKGAPGFDDVGTFGDGTLAALYNATASNVYTAGIKGAGGKITLGAAAAYTVSGSIVCDTPGPAPGSWIGVESVVSLYNSTDALVSTTKSDWDGNYVLKGVPAGDGYYVKATKSKYDTGLSPAFSVSANGTIPQVRLDRTKYPVSGTIYGAVNSDGSGKTPLAGVEVYVISIGNGYRVLGGPALTDSQGNYTVYATTDSVNSAFCGLAVKVAGAAAKYGTQITLFEKDDLYGRQVGDLDLNMGTQTHLILDDFVYPANTARLGAEGTFAFTLGGPTSQVVTGRDLTMTETQDVHLRSVTKSNTIYYQLRKWPSGEAVGAQVRSVGTTNGDDMIRNVPKGQYYIELTRAGYVSVNTMPFTVDTTRLMLRDGQSTNTIDINAQIGANVVTGKVVDAVSGDPLGNVSIVFQSWSNTGGTGNPVLSGADGTFSYDVVADDKEIFFSKEGYITKAINVASGGAAGLTIELIPLSGATADLSAVEFVEEAVEMIEFVEAEMAQSVGEQIIIIE